MCIKKKYEVWILPLCPPTIRKICLNIARTKAIRYRIIQVRIPAYTIFGEHEKLTTTVTNRDR